MNRLNHIAFIMDGNGRWGVKKKRGRNYGHLEGVKVVKKIVKTLVKKNIPLATFYVFSSENWRRPKKEINFLFKLIKNYFSQEIGNIIKQGIRINIIGETNKLPSDIKKTLKKSMSLSKKNKKILVNLALNYGSKRELISAFKKIKLKKITEKNLNNYLYTKKIPDPDILIRTGGKKRLSNFMLWQLAYTELYFLDKLWPDFKEKDLKKVLNHYLKIKRNFGGI